MTDSFTEVTYTGWGSRIMGSIVGVGIGILLVIACCIGLFWNEGRAVQTQRSLTEGASLVVDIDPVSVDPANEGKLVHASGAMKAGADVSDPEFGVIAGGLRLLRTVEMYQWKEEKKTETHKNVGGSEDTVTTYTYSRVWSEGRINSQNFRQAGDHQNPQLRYPRAIFTARDITFGAFHPSDRVIAMLPADEKVSVPPALADAVRAKIGGPALVTDGLLYLGTDPQSPHLGDLRISYSLVPAGTASIIGRQAGTDFGDYQTKAGDALLLARPGNVSAAEMFTAAQQDNVVLTWIIRGFAAFLMFIGFTLLLRPFVVIADVIPFIGSILGAGAALVGLIATICVASVVIAVAWMWYRPFVSIAVLAGAFVIVFGLKKLASGRKAMAVPQATPAR